MSDTIVGKIVILLSVFLICGILIFSNFGGENRVRVYDCGMADWHPDIPKEVREECRRIRYEEWKKQNEKVPSTTFQRAIQT